MSRASKAQKQMQNRKRQTRNSARKEAYAKNAGTTSNTKKKEGRAAKRARLKANRVKLVNPFDHPYGPCGNIGCKKCFVRLIYA